MKHVIDSIFSDPAVAQAYIAGIALIVSIFALGISGITAFLQWRERNAHRRQTEVPEFETVLEGLVDCPNWYSANITMRNLGTTQVNLERIIAKSPGRMRLVSQDSLQEEGGYGGFHYRKPEAKDGTKVIGSRLSVAPYGSAGDHIQHLGIWPGTADHHKTLIYVYLPHSRLGFRTRSISLKLSLRRKGRRDSVRTETIRAYIPS
jgi:hypothetical protein